MLPVIAIVGRPNVGKSTLFNALTRSRDALVADRPGVTRDRNYGLGRIGERRYVLIDTGGLSDAPQGIARLTSDQAHTAIGEADVLLFMVDARAGLNAEDERIAAQLRTTGKPLVLVPNKVDGLDEAAATAEFHALGFDTVAPVSASHRRGLRAMADAALALAGASGAQSLDEEAHAPGAIRVAVIGRPNVGKSTLVNRLTGSNRVVTHDTPGTTRDSVQVPFERDGQAFVLIDTAGLRRRTRVQDAVEKFSAIKTIKAIDASQVVILMLDARDGVTDHDTHLLGLALDAGRAVVIAANKWDGLTGDQRARLRSELDRRLRFVDFARILMTSALHGSGLAELLDAVRRAHAAATADLSTPDLTRVLHAAVERTPPPLVHGRRIKLRYAHQGGSTPPRIVIHGNQTESVPDHYRRYLERVFREAFDLFGTPVVLELRTGENPFKGRRNTLTPHQQRKRERLMRKVKKRR
jgi:GTP-binding protein